MQLASFFYIHKGKKFNKYVLEFRFFSSLLKETDYNEFYFCVEFLKERHLVLTAAFIIETRFSKPAEHRPATRRNIGINILTGN